MAYHLTMKKKKNEKVKFIVYNSQSFTPFWCYFFVNASVVVVYVGIFSSCFIFFFIIIFIQLQFGNRKKNVRLMRELVQVLISVIRVDDDKKIDGWMDGWMCCQSMSFN